MNETNTQLVPAKDKIATVRGMLEKMRDQIKMALPAHLTTDRMLRVAMTTIQRNPKLLDCTPQSLLGSIMQAAQLGLEPDGLLGQAYLVPYGKTVTLIPGYRGLMQLARRSGEISTIQAHVVNARDSFTFSYGLEPKLEHIPTQEEDSGPFVAVYAIARLKDGGSQFVVMWRRQVDAIRKRSKAGVDGPWVTDYDEMAKKTALRRLFKLLPCSIELATAVSLDERAESGLPQDLDVTIDAEALPESDAGAAGSKLDQFVEDDKKRKSA